MAEQNLPNIEMQFTGDDVFVVFDGRRIAKRGDRTWISLEPGWEVFDIGDRDGVSVAYRGTVIQ